MSMMNDEVLNVAPISNGDSIQIKRRSGAAGAENPFVAQTVTVQANATYTLSMFNLLRAERGDTGSSIIFSVYTEGENIPVDNATILASKDSVYTDLENADAPEGNDSFFQDTLTFNSGNNTELTILSN